VIFIPIVEDKNMANYISANKSRRLRPQVGTPALFLLAAVCCVLTFTACSDSKDTKQNATTSGTAPTAVGQQATEAPKSAAAIPTEEKKADQLATAKELTTAAKEAISPAAKSAEPMASATTKTKDDILAPDTKTKEVAPVSKTQETATPPKKEEVASAKEPAAAAPLSLKMNIIGQRKEADGSYTEVLASEGSVMRSRDNFQIHFEVNRPAHVYILMYDSEGKAGQIYPDAKAGQSAAVQAGRKLVLPSKDLWFWLDDSTGTETIYVLASETPMADITSLLTKMEGGNEAGQQRASRQIKERIAVMQRGVGGITKGDAVTYTLSDGKKIQKVTDVVTGTGSVVRAVSFQHR
jgi:hypothetical protein